MIIYIYIDDVYIYIYIDICVYIYILCIYIIYIYIIMYIPTLQWILSHLFTISLVSDFKPSNLVAKERWRVMSSMSWMRAFHGGSRRRSLTQNVERVTQLLLPPGASTLSLLHRRAAVATQCEWRFRGIVASESEARRFFDEQQRVVLSWARNVIKQMGRTPRFQFKCCSALLWVEIHRMSWKSLESLPSVRWVPQSDPREHALSLGWWTPKRGCRGLFPQLYRCLVFGYRSEWHPPRLFLCYGGPGTGTGWQLDLGWLQLDILHKCKDGPTPMSFTASIPHPGPLTGFCRVAWVVSSIDP